MQRLGSARAQATRVTSGAVVVARAGAAPTVTAPLADRSGAAVDAVPAPARPRTSRRPLRLLGALVAGGLFVAAFPGHDVWIAAPASTAVLALALHRARGWAAALIGFVFGCTAMLPVLHWAGIYVGPVPWIALGVASGAFYAPFGTLVAWASRSRPALLRRLWPIAYGGLWVAVEAARSRVPFHGFPWARLAFSQAGAPDLTLAAWGGAPLIGFAVAVAGGLVAQAVLELTSRSRSTSSSGSGSTSGRRARPARRLAVVVAPLLLAAAITFGPALLTVPTAGQPDATGKTSVRIAMIQGNVDRSGLQSEDYAGQVLENHVRLTLALAADIRAGRTPRPDFVLWPENAADDDPTADPVSAAQLTRAADAVGVPIVAGVILDGPGEHRRNAVLVWNPGTGLDTSPTGTYVKRYPAPFGEYIPLRSIARRFSSAVDLVPVDMVRGSAVGHLVVDPGQAGQVVLGPAICFEVAFDNVLRDDVRAGADLLVVPTNNATFGHSDESVQQLAMARVRAVEHGRAVLSDSTVGVSAVIRPDGSLVGETTLFTPAIVTATVPLRTTLTLSDRIGGGLEAVLVLLGLLAAGVGVFSGTRRGRRFHPARTVPATGTDRTVPTGGPDRSAPVGGSTPRSR